MEARMFFTRRLVVGLIAVALGATVLFGATSFRGQAATRAGAARTNSDGTPPNARTLNAADDVRGARLVAVMGQSSLDLRQLNLAPGERLFVDVFVTMGRATVRIPAHWVVTTTALPVMGFIKEAHVHKAARTAPGTVAPATGPPPQLILRGIAVAGKVEVTS
jgi:hypothetical protein